MGNVTGFMEYERLKHYKEFVIGLDDKRASLQAALHAAWTAAHRFATMAAQSTTSFRTLTIWSIVAVGKKPLTCFIAPITSPNLQDTSALMAASPNMLNFCRFENA